MILKAARGLYGYFWVYWGFLYIGVVGLAYNIVCWALHPLVHGPAPARTARRVLSMLMRVFWLHYVVHGEAPFVEGVLPGFPLQSQSPCNDRPT